MRLRDPVQNIRYAGAYLKELHKWVDLQAPRNVSQRQRWELAVVAYNVGIEKLKESIRKHGWGALSREGLNYYYHVIPHVRRIVPFIYPD
jgi:soluble lytic murein transglycosylase-like protein